MKAGPDGHETKPETLGHSRLWSRGGCGLGRSRHRDRSAQGASAVLEHDRHAAISASADGSNQDYNLA